MNRYWLLSRPFLLAFVLCCACVIVDGATPGWVPIHEGWVSDTSHVLSRPDRDRLAAILNRYSDETSHPIEVLIIPTLSGESIETFSLRVANSWSIGNKGLDDGILVTLAMKEREVRIELGKGMERYISDATAKSIVASSMTPAFAKGNYAGGLEGGLSRIMEEARNFVVKPRDR